MKKRKKINKYQRLIRKFLKDPDSIWKNVKLIKREMSIAKKLYVKVNNERFWKEADLPFKLNSLAWLLSEDGVKFLNLEALKLKLNLPSPIKYDINDQKIGKDKRIKKTEQTTLMEFLKDA